MGGGSRSPGNGKESAIIMALGTRVYLGQQGKRCPECQGVYTDPPVELRIRVFGDCLHAKCRSCSLLFGSCKQCESNEVADGGEAVEVEANNDANGEMEVEPEVLPGPTTMMNGGGATRTSPRRRQHSPDITAFGGSSKRQRVTGDVKVKVAATKKIVRPRKALIKRKSPRAATSKPQPSSSTAQEKRAKFGEIFARKSLRAQITRKARILVTRKSVRSAALNSGSGRPSREAVKKVKVEKTAKEGHHRCTICNMTFFNDFNLRRHFACQAHLDKVKEIPVGKVEPRRSEPRTSSSKIVKKTSPKTVFSSPKEGIIRKGFAEVKVVQGDPLLYECSFCNKQFKTKANIEYHSYCSQEREKPFKCSLCDDSFIKKSHFEYHMETKHFLEKLLNLTKERHTQ